jgi:hypothetical protein
MFVRVHLVGWGLPDADGASQNQHEDLLSELFRGRGWKQTGRTRGDRPERTAPRRLPTLT